jgi:RNA polymerase sigma-70 factor (ECF subfamily)
MCIETLYKNYKIKIIEFTARIVWDREIAEDIAQECFITFFRVEENQQIENPGGFLYQTAKYLAFDHLKHKKVTTKYLQLRQLSDESELNSPSAEQVAATEQYLEVVKEVIDELSPRCRETLLLNKFFDMNYAEIAKATGISESGVEKHMMKGLKHCRKKIPEFMPKQNKVRTCQSPVV